MNPSFFDELNRLWFDKVAAELTEAARKELPKKDFAVPATKSNTGEKAYPIPDRQHARSALGFAKMHGDSSDYARVRAKVEAKFPDMLKKASRLEEAKNIGRNVARHLGHAAGGALDTVTGPINTVTQGLSLNDSKRVASGVGGVAAIEGVHQLGIRRGRRAAEKEKDSTMLPPGQMPPIMKMGGTLMGLGPMINEAGHVAEGAPSGVKERVIGALANRFSHPMDLAGLGVLGLPAADQLQAHTRAGLSGKYNKEEVKKREILPHVAHPLAELGGLGMIAAPVAAQMIRGQH